MSDYRLPYDSIEAGQKYMATVKGWVMLKKVEPGEYRIEVVNRGWHGRCINFYRPKGKKLIVCHTLGDCFLSYPDCPDLNAIIVTKMV